VRFLALVLKDAVQFYDNCRLLFRVGFHHRFKAKFLPEALLLAGHRIAPHN
jgi:hypothetical protein